MLNTSLLRLTWSVIEDAQTTDLLALTDTGLVRLLLQKISSRSLLSGEEICCLYDYISSKSMLIRDMAQSRFTYQAPSLTQLDEDAESQTGAAANEALTVMRSFDVLECQS
ncbi:MAG: hypothetical protein NW220_24625 [Leptolyngbyaceae cyanobacterium bins.349]|nr:hypothetical protein [Leptolyngbyaceae cyanobacterium bins.349]